MLKQTNEIDEDKNKIGISLFDITIDGEKKEY